MDIKQLDSEYIMGTYARFPVTLVKGEGSLVYDDSGKDYIDFGSGIGVTAFGYCDGEWLKAVSEQASLLQHTSNLYYTQPCARLAQLMCERTGMSKVFFSNSGAEANECAIKAARRYSLLKNGEGYSTIITLINSFHGRTVTTLAATGQEHYHTDFAPFTEGFVYADATNPQSVIELAEKHRCAAIMLETIQGEGGVTELLPQTLEAIKDVAAKKNIPLIIDEVQTGNGRTGKLYSYMHHGLNPDIVTTAKGLGGGLPIGATLFSERFSTALVPGTHGSTFGGNPVVCAGALSVFERLNDKMLGEVTAKGEFLREALGKCNAVKSISGRGLMLGLELEDAKGVATRCRENGLLVLTAKDRLRLLPPLNTPYELLERGAQIIMECC